MYTETNYKTKKELKAALAAGKQVRVFQPNQMFAVSMTGKCTLEGPHYPKPHSWYATCQIVDGVIVPGSLK